MSTGPADDGGTPLPSTIAAEVVTELVVKKSRFIAHLAPVTEQDQADAVVAAVRKTHWDARHHCTAMVLGVHADRQRSSDDGEPSGTAGVPMLEVLRRRRVTDLVAVVTRYFGGVLLGAGGLVRAYSGAVADAVDAARLVRRSPMTELSIAAPHADAGRLAAFLHTWCCAHDAVIGEVRYDAEASFAVQVSPAALAVFRADLAAFGGGTLHAVQHQTRVVDLPADRAG